MWRSGCILLVSLLPTTAWASISITEIAWMGDSVSANNEWLELYNDGNSSVLIDGWRLTDGGNLDIALAGTIGAGEYVLLERNRSSEAYLKKPPFLVYTGAMVNTGATLTLYRGDGGIEDRVAGGEGWGSVGGDNVTKETAQYSSQGWVTAPASPGRVTNAQSTRNDDEEEEEKTEEKKSGNTNTAKSKDSDQTVRMTLPAVTLEAVIDVQSVAYVNQPVVMTALPQGIGRSLLPSVSYEWNFGDMATSTGEMVKHSYMYPGTYVVTVFAYYKRQQHVSRHEITILPVTLSMTKNSAGDIQVHNDSAYDIDASGYQVIGNNAVVFPPRSIIAARSTVTIPRAAIGSPAQGTVYAYDSNGKMVAEYGTKTVALADNLAMTVPISRATAPVLATVAGDTNVSEDTLPAGFAFLPASAEAPPLEPEALAVTNESTSTFPLANSQNEIVPETTISSQSWTYIALLVILIMSILAVFWPRSNVRLVKRKEAG